jgi:succinyl-diaminopimelate desuccinylase
VDAVELTRTLIAFDSRNPPGDERACAGHLAALLGDHGFEVEIHDFAPKRSSVVARRGDPEAGPPLCLTGHLDTVPLGVAEWSVDPFAGEIREGRLYGRGASDMKSGVAAIVAAACHLVDGLEGNPGVTLVLTAGEETGCEGAFDLAARGALGRAGALLVAEPTGNRPKIGHKGALWLKGLARGHTAHGSMPEHGDNALHKAARAVTKLVDFGFNVAPHPHLGRATLNVGTLHGGLNVNSVPDAAELGVDIRTLPGMDHAALREALAGYLGEDLSSLEAFVDLGGVWTDPDDPWIRDSLDLIAPRLTEPPAVEALPFFTDAAALQPAFGGVPTLILGPGETHMAHQTDEYCIVERIPEAVAMIEAIIERWQTLPR